MQKFDHARMKGIREAADMIQPEAAKRAGMSVSQWSDIESGARTNVTVDTLGRIAFALRCDACDLLTPAKPARPAKRKGAK